MHEVFCVQGVQCKGNILKPLSEFAEQRTKTATVQRVGTNYAITRPPWTKRGNTILVPFEERGELVPVLVAIFEKVVEQGKGSGGKGVIRVGADVSWNMLIMLLVEGGGQLPQQFDSHLGSILGLLSNVVDLKIGPFKVPTPPELVSSLRRMAIDGAHANAKCAASVKAIEARVAEQLQEVREKVAKMTATCMQEIKQLAEKQDSNNTSQCNFNAELLRKVEKLFKMYTDAEHAHAAYGAAYSEAFAQQEGDIRAVAKEVINLSTRVSGLSAEMGQVQQRLSTHDGQIAELYTFIEEVRKVVASHRAAPLDPDLDERASRLLAEMGDMTAPPAEEPQPPEGSAAAAAAATEGAEGAKGEGAETFKTVMDQSESLIDAEEGSAAPPLLVIAVTGFKRRDFDKLALTSSGIEIRGDLDSDTKILVASEGSGLSQREDGLANKVQACKANCDIPIVNIEWVYASLSAGRPVEVEAYLATDEYLGMPRADPPSIAEDATSVEPAAAAAAAEEGEATEVAEMSSVAEQIASNTIVATTPPIGAGAPPEGEAAAETVEPESEPERELELEPEPLDPPSAEDTTSGDPAAAAAAEEGEATEVAEMSVSSEPATPSVEETQPPEESDAAAAATAEDEGQGGEAAETVEDQPEPEPEPEPAGAPTTPSGAAGEPTTAPVRAAEDAEAAKDGEVTAPRAGNDGELYDASDVRPWAKLYSLDIGGGIHHMNLNAAEVVVGRKSGVPADHFKLSLRPSSSHRNFDACLEDCSLNGTYINTQLIGKGRFCLLEHGDMIALDPRPERGWGRGDSPDLFIFEDLTKGCSVADFPFLSGEPATAAAYVARGVNAEPYQRPEPLRWIPGLESRPGRGMPLGVHVPLAATPSGLLSPTPAVRDGETPSSPSLAEYAAEIKANLGNFTSKLAADACTAIKHCIKHRVVRPLAQATHASARPETIAAPLAAMLMAFAAMLVLYLAK